jgi:hypothetical protein
MHSDIFDLLTQNNFFVNHPYDIITDFIIPEYRNKIFQLYILIIFIVVFLWPNRLHNFTSEVVILREADGDESFYYLGWTKWPFAISIPRQEEILSDLNLLLLIILVILWADPRLSGPKPLVLSLLIEELERSLASVERLLSALKILKPRIILISMDI